MIEGLRFEFAVNSGYTWSSLSSDNGARHV